MNLDEKYPLLCTIGSPGDLKKLSLEELKALAAELRGFIVETVSKTGGHLGSNLGAVELATALHYVYDTPRDLIVWDVGAQAYPHKILTGRLHQFHTLRQYGGIAPFPRRDESPYDTFGVGHSSTSISAALGMAVARDRRGEDYKVVAVIGDGGMTGGMAFEGLNNAGAMKTDLTVVLNDNSMSISPNVGALSQHFASLRADLRFEQLKDSMWQLTGRLPRGSKLRRALHGVDAGIRAMLIPGLWFERLGFRYVGPINGHDLDEMVKMFRWLRTISGPVLIHILTEKGKGYRFAEEDRINLHSISKMDPATGPDRSKPAVMDFSAVFSDELTKIAARDPRIVAITPAMLEGSKLVAFQEAYPDRTFDVGIAEQHAVTFAAGLAACGFRPVVAIYSTFLQRAYDQVVHDVALQNLPVVFGVDRAGLVGEDGPTHHGSFDIAYLRHVPNMTLLAARDEPQLRVMLRAALEVEGPVAIRFPRGTPPAPLESTAGNADVWRPVVLTDAPLEGQGVIIGVGTILYSLLAVAKRLAEEAGIVVPVVDLQCIKPLDAGFLAVLATRFERWFTVEEGSLQGGMGSALLEFLSDRGLDKVRVRRVGLPDRFIAHGDRDSLYRDTGLDPETLYHSAQDFFSRSSRGSLAAARYNHVRK